MMRLFDTHGHLNDPRFDEDREQVIGEMLEKGICCACIGADMASSRSAVALAEKHPHIWAAVGVHPHDAKDYDAPRDEPELRALCEGKRVVGLGEIGLDYHYDNSPREVQRQVFVRQLLLARELGLPALLHVREAHGDTIDLLRAHAGELPRLLLHCYSGSVESAKVYLSMGAVISLAGPVTYPNAHNLKEVAAYVPSDRLLIETDCPYLAPQPVRGKRNSPLNVHYVAEEIAALRGMDMEELCEITFKNALAFYRIDESEVPYVGR